MKSLLLLTFLAVTANADPVRINELASKKIFFILTRAGAEVTQLSHNHDREYAIQESVRAQNINCEFGNRISCVFEIRTNGTTTEARRIQGEDAWDVGFNLAEAGIRRIETSNDSHTVAAKSLHCILKSAGQSATCIAEE